MAGNKVARHAQFRGLSPFRMGGFWETDSMAYHTLSPQQSKRDSRFDGSPFWIVAAALGHRVVLRPVIRQDNFNVGRGGSIRLVDNLHPGIQVE